MYWKISVQHIYSLIRFWFISCRAVYNILLYKKRRTLEFICVFSCICKNTLARETVKMSLVGGEEVKVDLKNSGSKIS